MTIDAWQHHAQQRLRTTAHHPSRAPDHLYWTPDDDGSGPGTEILGPIRGHPVLELGCGPGHHLAHLTAYHGATTTGIDTAPAQISRARLRYGHLGIELRTADALSFLSRSARQFQVVYSIFGAVGLTPPHALVHAVNTRLRPGGHLVVSVPHPYRSGADAASSPARQHLALSDTTTVSIDRWDLTPDEWHHLLTRAGLIVDAVEHVTPPAAPSRPTTLLVRASRPHPPG